MRLAGWKEFVSALRSRRPRLRPKRRASRRRRCGWPVVACISESLETRTLLSANSIAALVGGNLATEISVAGGEQFSFNVLYDASGNAETTNGDDTITARLHFDSAALTFDSLNDVLTGGDIVVDPSAGSVTVQPDTADVDGDVTTDSFVAISFTSQTELPSPAVLFTANFTAAAGQTANTVVNFSGAADAGDTLQTTPLTVDAAAPQAVLAGPAGPLGMGPFSVSLEFGEDVIGFDPSLDLVLSNALLTNSSGSNGSFTITVRPLTGGLVTIDLPADVAQDAGGNGNLAATQYSVTTFEQDFGDAPDSYDTSALFNGPRHFPEGPTLGTFRDVEADAQTPFDGTGDDRNGTVNSSVTETISAAPIVTLQTNFGSLSIQLDPNAAPQTVANFLKYVTDGDFDEMIFHRLLENFVLQGGGFTTSSEVFESLAQFATIPTDAPVDNEFSRSNVRGTVAMAKLPGDPDSATSGFFFNLADNSQNLDNQNGGFTVFGELTDLTLLDQLATIPTQDEGGAFTDLPVTDDDRLIVVRFAGVGSASGTVFDDSNSNGVQDGSEFGLANVTVFADINNDSRLDGGDIFTTTDTNGEYTLEGLPLGDVVIRQVLPLSTVQSQPNSGDGYTLTTSVGSLFEGVDFGSVAAVDADAFFPGGDEDGVHISDDFRVITGTSESATVTIQNSNGDARLYAWVDFNGDGDFEDVGEQIADGTGDFADLSDGEVTVPFVVSTGFTGNTFARFRVSTDGELVIGGEATDGEVEDYALSIESEDTTAPTPVLSGPTSPINSGTFDIAVDFGEPVAGFDQNDIVVGNGTVTGISGGSDGSFTVTMTATADGQVTVDIPADAAVDAAENSSLAATQLAVTVDTAAPQPILSGPQASNQSTFTVTIDFGETVTGFASSDIIVGNGTIASATGGVNGVFTVTMTATADGQVTVDIPADVAADTADNANLAAAPFAVTVDTVSPQPLLSGPQTSNQSTFTVAIDFSEPVTGFEASDIIVGNGTVQNLSGGVSGVFIATVRATTDGDLTVDIAAGVAQDAAANTSEAASRLTVAVNTQTTAKRIATGAGAGGGPRVRVFDAATGVERLSFFAYDVSFTGGVQVAVGDITGDGVEDVITGAGAGGGPHVKVFDGQTGTEVRSFFAYEEAFHGGVFVAADDVDNDGFADIITGAGAGGGPRVRVFSGRTRAVLHDFFAYTVGFTGGVHVAAGDVSGNGFADIVTGADAGGGPHVKVFDGQTGATVRSFFAYEETFHGGVFVAAGDIDNDGFADIITGAGAGGGPRVRVFSGRTETVLQDFFAYDTGFSGGVRVAAEDTNGDDFAEIMTGAGAGGGPHVRVLDGRTLDPLDEFFAFDPEFGGGVFVN